MLTLFKLRCQDGDPSPAANVLRPASLIGDRHAPGRQQGRACLQRTHHTCGFDEFVGCVHACEWRDKSAQVNAVINWSLKRVFSRFSGLLGLFFFFFFCFFISPTHTLPSLLFSPLLINSFCVWRKNGGEEVALEVEI
ncbi:hypothetical protein L209DRAFT_40250 [Thermothelomyces heterothallicus CBS 203.75]